MASKRQSVQEKSYGALKGPTINYHVVKEIEQESSCIYGMKGQSLKGKQIFWLPPAILSQSKLKYGRYVLLSKGFEHLKEEGTLTSAPQHRKNQWALSVQIIFKIGVVITLAIHCHKE